MIGPAPICLDCKHYRGQTKGFGLKCKAFVRGIPDAILVGGNKHRKPYPGDHGIRFEPREETPA